MAASDVTGVGLLVGFALRRDRVRLAAWVLGIAAGVVMVAASFPGVYPDAAARATRATIMQSPAAVAFSGPRVGVDDYKFGAMLTNEMLGFASVLVALMSIFTVVRHTRADEEAGRTELVRASVVGRHAPLAAGLIVAFLANGVLAVLVAVGLGALGLDGVGWAGSWLFASALASVGIVFAGVAALTAQVSDHGRTATGLAGLVLGAAYGLRAIGDVGRSPVSWLSPIGWAQRTNAYVHDTWWPIAVAVAVTAVLCAAAATIGSKRDFGAGLRQPRPGPGRAAPYLGTTLGLALRLERGALIAWTASFLGFGLVYGALIGEVREFAGQTERVRAALAGIGGDDLIKSFLALLVMLLAMTAAIFAVLATLRARTEEATGRAESVLTLPVGRGRWLSSHAAVAAAGSVVVTVAGALGVGISAAASLGDSGILGDILRGSAAQIPPLLLVVGVTVALYGLAPRAAGAVWILIVYAMATGILGGLLGLPQWAMDISPFAVVPRLPAQAFSAWPFLWMLPAAAALFATGLWGLRRRDMRTGG